MVARPSAVSNTCPLISKTELFSGNFMTGVPAPPALYHLLVNEVSRKYQLTSTKSGIQEGRLRLRLLDAALRKRRLLSSMSNIRDLMNFSMIISKDAL